MPFIRSIRKNYNVPKSEVKATDVFDITGGDVIYTAGGYTFHAFTTVGEHDFNVKLKSKFNERDLMRLQTDLDLEFLVVAGGGGGGGEMSDGGSGGGGGAGGYRSGTLANQGVGSYPVQVGGGGTGAPSPGGGNGYDGGTSQFGSTSATGGGGGGYYTNTANPGGSGGGGG